MQILKHYTTDHDEIFTGDRHQEWAFMGGSTVSPTNLN